jgi:hypothetical protein
MQVMFFFFLFTKHSTIDMHMSNPLMSWILSSHHMNEFVESLQSLV